MKAIDHALHRRKSPPRLPAKACPGCGRAFQPAQPNQRHCRPSCKAARTARRADLTPSLFEK